MLFTSYLFLQELVQTSSERLTKLATKWEEVRAPLVQQLRQLKTTNEAAEVGNDIYLFTVSNYNDPAPSSSLLLSSCWRRYVY